MNFLVLSSSRGTTFQAVLDRLADGTLTMECLGLITDKPDRGCIEKAREADMPVEVVERREEESKESYDARLLETMKRMGADPKTTVIAALGWMFIFTKPFIHAWKNRIINVHPALLPRHGGKGMYGMKVHEAVLASGDKKSGITIHLMDEDVDTGPVLLQMECPVETDDTPASLKNRVQALEKEWYPKVLEMIEEGEIELKVKS